jgi:hypothetical protein
MVRDPSRLFAIAALAVLAVTATLGWQVLFPAHRSIQSQRIADQLVTARGERDHAAEEFEGVRGSLAYRRVEEAAARPGASDPVQAQLAVYRSDLDRAEARVARLEAHPGGIREQITHGGAVERCVTCHPGMDDLGATHAALGPDSPYQGWGCTVCHGGNGRALRVDVAHRDLVLRPWTRGPAVTLEPMVEALLSEDKHERAAAAAALHRLTGRDFGYSYHAPAEERALVVRRWRIWWAANATIWRPPHPPGLDASGYDAGGRPLPFVGSGSCLRCHESRQRRHVERWRATKFTSFERLDEVDDGTACLPCHTTGYDPREGTWIQEGVTCEGCHGPGADYAAAMAAGVLLQGRGEIDEGERLLDEVSTQLREQMAGSNVCVDCHDPFGVKDLAYEHVM